jgi:hypothetical protein
MSEIKCKTCRFFVQGPDVELGTCKFQVSEELPYWLNSWIDIALRQTYNDVRSEGGELCDAWAPKHRKPWPSQEVI